MKYQELQDEVKAALKAHDKPRVSILRQVHGEVKNIEVNERREITDADVDAMLKRVIKQTKETLEGSIKAGNNQERTDLLAAQVEIAMRRFACIAQLRQQEQEGHGVGTAAQGHDDFAACFQQTFLGNVLGNFLLFHTCKGSINQEKYKRRKQRFRAFLFPRCRCFISRSAFLRKALLCNL